MKHHLLYLATLFLLMGCSSSDSPEEMEEVTISLPGLTTVSVSAIQQNAATITANIDDNGGAVIIERGVVWDANENPTIADDKLASGSGVGSFEITLTNLESDSKFYVRSYARNSEGIAYGNQLEFTTLPTEEEQRIFEGDVSLFTQQDVNDFGEMGYTEITGRLFCGGNFSDLSRIGSLGPLSSIRKVGELWINANQDLRDLDGLENLLEVDGVARLSENVRLEDISALSNLSRITGWLGIMNNENLSVINQFDALEEVEFIQIVGNKHLELVDTFNKITEMESFVFAQNEGVGFIGGFSNLQKMNRLIIEDNEGAFTIDSFHEVREIENTFSVLDNGGLVSIVGFDKLELFSGGVVVNNSPVLEEIRGFNSLQSFGGIRLTNNPKLLVLDAFNQVQIMEDGITISFAPISDFNNFRSLEEVGDFWIGSGMNALQNFEGLSNLTTINGSMRVVNNEILANLDGLEGLTSCSSIELGGNESLNDFCALRTLLELNPDIENNIAGNAFNPTPEEIVSGNCAQ